MKFNIKNFPRTADGENRDEADIWVEGFEKELRELFEDDIHYISKKDVLKEILGEDKE
jgi:hypothetical protein